MKRKLLIAAGLILLPVILLGSSGCRRSQKNSNAQSESNSVDVDPRGDRPAMIMVGGTLYYLDQAIVAIVSNTDVIGYTSSYTDNEPAKEGETNFSRQLGLPYARVKGGIAVKYEGQWHLFVAKDSNTDQKSGITWNEANYTPDYDSTSTLHADKFLDKLKKDGYHRGGEIDRDYNTDNVTGVFYITPRGIAEEEPDLEFFYVKPGCHCFMMYKGEIYRYDTFGGYHHKLVLWDYDGNGVKDLVSYYSWGSGIPYLSASVSDLSTMKTYMIISRSLFSERGFSFAFDGENVYIDGEKLSFSDGAFYIGSDRIEPLS